jgi:hypothetical protein
MIFDTSFPQWRCASLQPSLPAMAHPQGQQGPHRTFESAFRHDTHTQFRYDYCIGCTITSRALSMTTGGAMIPSLAGHWKRLCKRRRQQQHHLLRQRQRQRRQQQLGLGDCRRLHLIRPAFAPLKGSIRTMARAASTRNLFHSWDRTDWLRLERSLKTVDKTNRILSRIP